MSLEIVDVSSCKKSLVAEVPAEQVEEEIGKLARKYAQQAKVPGFRPGKVPLNIIRQRFNADLRSDVTQEIISRTWKQAVAERSLQPLAEPVVEKVDAEAGQPLKFVVSFEVMPEVKVTDYKGVSITTAPAAVHDADVAAALESLRNEHAQFVPVENAEVHDGHYLTVTLDGEFEGGGKPIHEEDVNLIVGAPQTNREFSASLQGARVDEVRSFDVAYPEDYRQKRLAGKRVHYQVKIKDIKEKQVAELNDDFARDVGSASLEELRSRTRDELVTKAKQAAEEKARETVLDQIVQRLSFDIPESLVREELEDNARRIAANLARQGIDVSKTSIDWKKVFDEERPFAEKSVRHRMVLDAIARQEQIEVTEQEVDAEFQKMAERGGKSAAAMRAQFEKDQRLQAFRMYLLQNKALDFIYRNANISEG
ncbi:MAG: trigger factor [Acidobacteriia bacterium]|nr:trigger factor [Terriglobia bacterium]